MTRLTLASQHYGSSELRRQDSQNRTLKVEGFSRIPYLIRSSGERIIGSR
jgi:hypothetical protein